MRIIGMLMNTLIDILALFRLYIFFSILPIGSLLRLFTLISLINKLFAYSGLTVFPNKNQPPIYRPEFCTSTAFRQDHLTFIYRIARLQDTHTTIYRTHIDCAGYSKYDCHRFIHLVLLLGKSFFH